MMLSISPNIFVQDIKKTVEYYQLLGFELVNKVPDTENFIWAMMTNGKVTFMFQSFDTLNDDLPMVHRNNGGALLLYIQVEAIRSFHDKIKTHVKVVKKLEKTFYGATEFSIEDINGYLLTFAEDEIE